MKLAPLFLIVVAVFVTGCTMVGGPVAAPIMLDLKGPGEVVDNSVTWDKTGTAEATGIICFSSGDASIAAAMQNGDITKVHHVDYESFNILGFYSKWKTIVYGE